MSFEEIIKIIEKHLAINMEEGTAHCEPPGPRLVKKFIEKNYVSKAKVDEAITEFNSTPSIWIDALVAQKAFAKLLKDLKLQ